MTVGKTAKISSPSMRRRRSALGGGGGGDDDLERETKVLASFYPSPPPVDFVERTVSRAVPASATRPFSPHLDGPRRVDTDFGFLG